MSGDVFGNGMLLSPSIKLVAAFDHRHVFVDPDPGSRRQSSPSASGCSMLPGSSWNDYDRTKLSPGGRGLRSQGEERDPLATGCRAALGIPDDAPDDMTPNELIKAGS